MDTKIHDAACFILGSSLVGGGIASQTPELFVIAAGAYSGLLISPDWDWIGKVVTRGQGTYIVSGRDLRFDEKPVKTVYGKVLRRWPKPYQYILRPYAQFFKHRKGRRVGLSHTFLIGTIIRVVWLGFPLIVLFTAPKLFGLWFVGLFIADIFHLILDFKV